MSFSHVRPYFRAHANSLQWKEWKDAFNVNNIPATIFNGAYHIEITDALGQRHNQYDLETRFTVNVRYFRRGDRETQLALDSTMQAAENYIRLVCKASNRLVGVGIKNVELVNVRWEPQDETNDNLIRTIMQFSTLVVLGID